MRDAHGGVQSVLVLGGGSDIATALVDRLLADRAQTVILAGRDLADLQIRAEGAATAGATTTAVFPFDAADTASHEALLDEIFEAHPDIDVVVAAWGLLGEPFDADMEVDRAVQIASVNYLGAVSACLATAKHLRAQGHGTIVAITSVAGQRVRRAQAIYGSAKAGFDGFAVALGDDLASSGVDVMVVRPGFVHTKMTEGLDAAPFSTTPEAVADDIVTGLRSRSRVVWSPKKLRGVFWGMRHLPHSVWRKIAER